MYIHMHIEYTRTRTHCKFERRATAKFSFFPLKSKIRQGNIRCKRVVVFRKELAVETLSSIYFDLELDAVITAYINKVYSVLRSIIVWVHGGDCRPGPALPWPGLAWPYPALPCPGLAWPGLVDSAWPGPTHATLGINARKRPSGSLRWVKRTNATQRCQSRQWDFS